MNKDQLRFERQELVNNILELENYLPSVTDDYEKKFIVYQLQAMRDYRSCLESRINLFK